MEILWGAMSYRALSNLHIIPTGQTVTTEYYIEEILKTLISAISRKRVTGSVLEIKTLPEMSMMILQQDGAPAHTSNRSQEWLGNNLRSFWKKGTWPVNFPDFSPIENLWAILQNRLDSLERPTNLKMLQNQLIQAWREITPNILDKLIASMPGRIKKCIELRKGTLESKSL